MTTPGLPAMPVDVDRVLNQIQIDGQEILTERLRQHARRFLYPNRKTSKATMRLLFREIHSNRTSPDQHS
jgi:hypothetical protein